MKPDLSVLRQRCPDVDERLVEEHLGRLDEGYFDAFGVDDVCAHLQALARLSAEQPVAVLSAQGSVTILGFDHASAFSLICGVLASVGFGITSGDVFTYSAPAAGGQRPRRRRDAFGRPVLDPYRRRRIIDRFVGVAAAHFEASHLPARREEVMRLLEAGETGRARQRVNEWVTERLRQHPSGPEHVLYPVGVETDNTSGTFTRLLVSSQDTPAFLYAFSTGLSFQSVSIERVRIATEHGAIHDQIDVTGPDGGPVSGPKALDLLRLSAVLTKHFTYFLDGAPDPSAALERFTLLVRDFLQSRGEHALGELVDPEAMQGLARLLGASDFLWEDFVRVQYETLLPFLHPRPNGQPLSAWLDDSPRRLAEEITAAGSFEDVRRRVNAYKDREAFMIDLEHILSAGRDVERLSARLTSLAERLLGVAIAAVYREVAAKRGVSAGVCGLFGLGKLGGAALGYASDLELLLVYRERGHGELFAEVVQGLTQFIQAKQDGLFQIDLKLRPYGIDGPLATTVEGFASYYGPGGPAHSLERLSLTRLRAIAGDAELGAQVEKLRDHVLYEVPSLNLDELRTTRLLQFEQKNRPGSYNAKYSPGSLVDVEYAAEILQVLYGKNHPSVRTPRTTEALRALQAIDILSAEDLEQALGAYDFLGRLINGLRMLRGWAGDLFLPDVDSEEFAHLARRMGYEPLGGLSASQQLWVEFQSRTAAVRAFVERRFGPAGLPGPVVANVADLVLSDRVPREVRERVLRAAGFHDPAHSYSNLRRLAGEDERRTLFARLVVLACEIIGRLPNPDLALDRWRRLVDDLEDPEAHFHEVLRDPRTLQELVDEI
jgi:[glutamine synthetase] adenylyltransferase / [glutamine synthetase]-adenylyl-L-tyrosine phosphorylase